MYPHERSLVKRLEDKPFAILGVNSDRDREQLKQVLKDEEITWRSWWNGGSTDGPISNAWNVAGWPTIYLIDHEGVIRYKNVRGDALDVAIDALVAAVPAAGDASQPPVKDDPPAAAERVPDAEDKEQPPAPQRESSEPAAPEPRAGADDEPTTEATDGSDEETGQ